MIANDKIRIEEIIHMNNRFNEWELDRMYNVIELLKDFSLIIENEKQKAPYRLNLLDDLRTNENAHSLILAKLVKHKATFIHFINHLNNFSEKRFYLNLDYIKNPHVTTEKMRIDVLVREEGKYALIIENKIHDAIEQAEQIERYIDKCLAIGFNIEQIYILYLSKTGYKPTEQTWGKYNPNNFTRRYFPISYQSNIIPWLQHYLRTLSKQEQNLLSSAIIQYIDHLTHIITEKNSEMEMNREIRNFIEKQMELKENKAENIEIIREKIKEIEELKDQLQRLSKLTKKELFNQWENNITNNFSHLRCFSKYGNHLITVGAILKFRGVEFKAVIESNFDVIYYGIMTNEDQKNGKIKEMIKPILSNKLTRNEPDWYGWEYTTFEEALYKFHDLVTELSKIEKNLKSSL